MRSQGFHSIPGIDHEEIGRVVGAWREAFPRSGVLAFVADADRQAVPELQASFRRLAVPLIGAVFPSLVADWRFQDRGLLLIRLDEMPWYRLEPDLAGSEDMLETRIEGLARALESRLEGAPDGGLFLIFDVMVPNIATLLNRLYLKLADRVHYMGANAGSETFAPVPCLFDSENFVRNGLLAVFLEGHDGALVTHGYRVPEAGRVTS